jgi:hypothetical protein
MKIQPDKHKKLLVKALERSEVMSRKCVGSKSVGMDDLKQLLKICIPEIN